MPCAAGALSVTTDHVTRKIESYQLTKPLILIGGTAGVGKTTLARRLCHKFGIDHRLSTGFIREVLRDQNTPDKCPLLYEYTFKAKEPVNTLVIQAELLERPLRACIERARQEGTSLILEGNHLIPKLYHDTCCALYAIVAAPDLEEHRRRMIGNTHAQRSVNPDDLARARIIDQYLRLEAVAYGVPCIRCLGEIDDALESLVSSRD